MNERITINPRICHGQACIVGTRIPVHQIVRMFANGDNLEALLKAYPTIKREDILACLDYAASLAEEQVTPLSDVVLAKMKILVDENIPNVSFRKTDGRDYWL